MPLDKETPLGEVGGFYRSTLIAALNTHKKAVATTRKHEEGISGITAHLDDMDEIVDEFLVVLGAKTVASVEGTPIGDAIRRGEGKHKAPSAQLDLLPEGVNVMDDSVISMMLEIIHYDAEPDAMAAEIATWHKDTRADVYRWARAMQLAGSDGVHVRVPPRPAIVPTSWLARSIFESIEKGETSPDTNAPVVPMLEDEIAHWIERGPWMPRASKSSRPHESDTVVPIVWRLAWNGELAEGETPREYPYEHETEQAARIVAANINRAFHAGDDDTSSEPAPEPPSDLPPSGAPESPASGDELPEQPKAAPETGAGTSDTPKHTPGGMDEIENVDQLRKRRGTRGGGRGRGR